MSGKLRFMFSILLCGIMPQVSAQNLSNPRGFYGRPVAGVLMSQLDGDQASGYNKFGYQAGIITGYRWQSTGFCAMEMQMLLCERGSRRAFDPITFVNAFHIRCRQAEIQLNGLYGFSDKRLSNLSVIGGLRFAKLLSVEEVEGSNPGISEDFRGSVMMCELGINQVVHPKVVVRLTFDYGLYSAVKSDRWNPLYPTGVYHNGVGVAALFNVGE
jgi:hypothetical protein